MPVGLLEPQGFGGVRSKKFELILRTIGSAGGRAKTKPPFRPPRLEAEAKRQTAKEPEKMSARTLFWPEAGFLNFYCLNSFYLVKLW